MDGNVLSKQLSRSLDSVLISAMFTEFVDLEKRYVLGDWEPATLNGGQFSEIVARLIYHVDSGNLNRHKSVDSCLKYIEDPTNNNQHLFPERRSALHLCKVLRTIYKFRSQRGAVHIDPDYSANELDSTLIISLARWVISEILRLFWVDDTRKVATVIREIIRYEVPAVMTFDGNPLVLHTDCSIQEEILLLLHNAGEKGLSRTDIGNAIPRPASSITRALQKLESADVQEIILRESGAYTLTPNGNRRIHTDLAGKLTSF